MRLTLGGPHRQALIHHQLVVIDQHRQVATQLRMGAVRAAATTKGLEIQKAHHVQQVVPPEHVEAAANIPAQVTDAVFQGDRLERLPERVVK